LDSANISSIDHLYTSQGNWTACTVEYGLIGLLRLKRQGGKPILPVDMGFHGISDCCMDG